jgi:hypothetical protein
MVGRRVWRGVGYPVTRPYRAVRGVRPGLPCSRLPGRNRTLDGLRAVVTGRDGTAGT